MHRRLVLIVTLTLICGVMLLASAFMEAEAMPLAIATPQVTPTFDVFRLAQPPTVFPPAQADNGAQTYWGMCMSCHGDAGQGLTDEWRNSYVLEERDCWKSGCHGDDAPKNSFVIPKTGVPALTGAGKLARFSNTDELYRHIHQNMPLFPTGSLTSEAAWSLTAYVMRLNDRPPDGFTLDETNGAAIPVHRKVKFPESAFPGALILITVLALAAIGWKFQADPGPARPNFLHHLHPPSIPSEQSRLRYTLGAGGLAVFLAFILLITGLLEMYYYIPTPEQAAISVQTIVNLVPFGNLVRNLHYWSAQFLVIVATIHLLRVTLTGAYAPPRRFNYLLGLGLLVLLLLLDFTGYVLRWDEGIHWALVVGANLLKTIPWFGDNLYQFVVGGTEAGAATLTRFYAWHIFGLTLGVMILVIWHIFRVRRDGGIAVPPPTERKDKERITRFELLRREVLMMTITIAILLLFSALVPAPIAPPITPTSVTTDSQAPWFFLWVQQLLKLGDPFLLGVLTPSLVVIALGLMPYLLPNAKNDELGRWFPRGNRLAQALTVIILFVILALTILGAVSS